MGNSDKGASGTSNSTGGTGSSATSTSAQNFSIAGKRVTIMGLGLHGGGRASSEYCLRRGARLCITDLRSEALLGESIAGLRSAFPQSDVSVVLGRHREEDFRSADVIIKNPAVRRTSPYLRSAQEAGVRIETDISLFLSEVVESELENEAGKANCTIIAVTGTKGKSTSCATVYHVLSEQARAESEAQEQALTQAPTPLQPRSQDPTRSPKHQQAQSPLNPQSALPQSHPPPPAVFLGGNITTSPLAFLPAVQEAMRAGRQVYVVLELSSFQIGDLEMVVQSRRAQGVSGAMHWPDYALLTNILPDHLDYYARMQDYVKDKAYLFARSQGVRIIGDAGDWAEVFLRASDSGDVHAQPRNSAAQSPARSTAPIISQNPVGDLLALLAPTIGCSAIDIDTHLKSFRGIPHRFEYIGRWQLSAGKLSAEQLPAGKPAKTAEPSQTVPVDIYNDSAATIPESCLRAMQGLKPARTYLICGGAEKNLTLNPLIRALALSARFYLLAGSASNEIEKRLRGAEADGEADAGVGRGSGAGTSAEADREADADTGAVAELRVQAGSGAGSQARAGADARPSANTPAVPDASGGQLAEKYSGTFGSMAEAIRSAHADIQSDCAELARLAGAPTPLPRFVLLLSPGTSSFGIFQNEFDRGRQFLGAVQEVAKVHPA